LRNWENLQEFKRFSERLVQYVEQNYRVKNDKDSRAIAGFSGGRRTLYLGLNNPEMFSWICGFAPGMLRKFERNNETAFCEPITH
jgi:enterochelin esterase family protein